MISLKKIKKTISKILENRRVKKFFKNNTFHLIILSSILFIGIFVNLLSIITPEKYELSIGQRSPIDIIAPRDIEDKAATEELIKKAIESVQPEEKIDPTIQIAIKKNIEKFFETLYQTRTSYESGRISLNETITDIKENNDFNLLEDEIFILIHTTKATLENLESYIYEVTTQVMSTGIKKEELDIKKSNIEEYFMNLEGFSSKLKSIAIKIVNSSIKENAFLDKELTQNKINEEIKKIEKVYIKKGQIIVGKGEIINERQYKLLLDAGLIDEQNIKKTASYVGAILLVLLLETVIFAYVYYFNKNIFYNISNLYLAIIIFLIILIASKPINSISNYLIPIATAPMLIGILLNPKIAIVLNICLATIITVITSNDLTVFITLLIGGTVGAISVSNTHQRTSIFLSGLIVSLCNFLIILSFGFIGNLELKSIMINSFYGVLNGLLCSILSIGSLPLWEYLFKILTPIKLLELSNPNHPLLKRLLLEAPGTYHHSVLVGNLSEAAAEAIGCNGLLARVGSFYHDIGKLTRPYFFKENQLTSENPHDKITPKISSTIIRNHVKDGIEIAKKYKLPKEIIKFIEEHHGTTLVKYFYHKALNIEKLSSNVKKDDYRYVGPKPSSKESAIIMIADSVEAAVRSMNEPTKKNIENLIKKITDDKLESGQLNNCNLTFSDIEKIKSAFLSTLIGIFHERIEYPDINKELEATK